MSSELISLDKHLDVIIDNERAINAHAESMIERAIESGRAALEIKASLPHGQFTKFMEEHCPVGQRQITRYMKAAEAQELLPEFKAQYEKVSHLNGGIKGFLDYAYKKPASLQSHDGGKQDNQNYIYLITNPAFPGWVKIGQTVDIERRLSEFQCSAPNNSYPFECHASFEAPGDLSDKNLHGVLRHLFDSEGEWFQMDVADAEKLLSGFLRDSAKQEAA